MDLTKKEFNETYYYKTELVELCRQFRLPSSGTKAELNSYINDYLSGKPSSDIRPKRSVTRCSPLKKNQISLQTKLIGTGFSFNNEARKFFAKQFGVKKFVFKKEMAMIKREAEVNNDTEITVGDLIEQYKKLEQTHTNEHYLLSHPEEQTYQWNQFVKDFCKSAEARDYRDKLKVAAILWNYVKKSPGPKIYTTDLVTKFSEEIDEFRK